MAHLTIEPTPPTASISPLWIVCFFLRQACLLDPSDGKRQRARTIRTWILISHGIMQTLRDHSICRCMTGLRIPNRMIVQLRDLKMEPISMACSGWSIVQPPRDDTGRKLVENDKQPQKFIVLRAIFNARRADSCLHNPRIRQVTNRYRGDKLRSKPMLISDISLLHLEFLTEYVLWSSLHRPYSTMPSFHTERGTVLVCFITGADYV